MDKDKLQYLHFITNQRFKTIQYEYKAGASFSLIQE
jgi:hypothetical protein